MVTERQHLDDLESTTIDGSRSCLSRLVIYQYRGLLKRLVRSQDNLLAATLLCVRNHLVFTPSFTLSIRMNSPAHSTIFPDEAPSLA